MQEHEKTAIVEVETDSDLKKKFIDKYTKDMINYTRRNITYKLWWRSTADWIIDCSWLISWRWHKNWLVSFQELHYSQNSYQVYSDWKKKDIEQLEKWDTIFFLNVSWWIHHIWVSMYSANIWSWTAKLSMIDANPKYWVTRRDIDISFDWKDWRYDSDAGKFKLRFSSNPMLERAIAQWKLESLVKKFTAHVDPKYKPSDFYEWTDFMVTNYTPWLWWINCGGAGCDNVASWMPIFEGDGYDGKIAACPEDFPFGTMIEIQWHWIVECKDGGWLIVLKWQKNSRWNISSRHRLDVYGWYSVNTTNISKWIYKVRVVR